MDFKSFGVFLLILPIALCGWRSDDAIKLKDVEVLTLYNGKMTKGRRSAPIPQLQCIGGTAGCRAFQPQVVQCYNRGWDGEDIQWECKTDMDNAYRFGKIAVSCEGYSYPEDPNILKGSCGLEYTIDYTKEGYGNQKAKSHDYYGGNYYASPSHQQEKRYDSTMSSFVVLIAICLVIYALYRTCLRPMIEGLTYSRTDDDNYSPRGPGFSNPTPPPPGFHPEFTQGSSGPSASCGSGGQSGNPFQGTGGFWTGAATGGLLGYMFGNRNNSRNSGTYYARPTPRADYSDNSFWGGTSSTNDYRSSGTADSSTGTRTASGFGGTRRR